MAYWQIIRIGRANNTYTGGAQLRIATCRNTVFNANHAFPMHFRFPYDANAAPCSYPVIGTPCYERVLPAPVFASYAASPEPCWWMP